MTDELEKLKNEIELVREEGEKLMTIKEEEHAKQLNDKEEEFKWKLMDS